MKDIKIKLGNNSTEDVVTALVNAGYTDVHNFLGKGYKAEYFLYCEDDWIYREYLGEVDEEGFNRCPAPEYFLHSDGKLRDHKEQKAVKADVTYSVEDLFDYVRNSGNFVKVWKYNDAVLFQTGESGEVIHTGDHLELEGILKGSYEKQQKKQALIDLMLDAQEQVDHYKQQIEELENE